VPFPLLQPVAAAVALMPVMETQVVRVVVAHTIIQEDLAVVQVLLAKVLQVVAVALGLNILQAVVAALAAQELPAQDRLRLLVVSAFNCPQRLGTLHLR
jgi:hypothetical protein